MWKRSTNTNQLCLFARLTPFVFTCFLGRLGCFLLCGFLLFLCFWLGGLFKWRAELWHGRRTVINSWGLCCHVSTCVRVDVLSSFSIYEWRCWVFFGGGGCVTVSSEVTIFSICLMQTHTCIYLQYLYKTQLHIFYDITWLKTTSKKTRISYCKYLQGNVFTVHHLLVYHYWSGIYLLTVCLSRLKFNHTHINATLKRSYFVHSRRNLPRASRQKTSVKEHWCNVKGVPPGSSLGDTNKCCCHKSKDFGTVTKLAGLPTFFHK